MSVAARTRRQFKRGFTLIESALATVIVGTGVLAIVSAQQAFHKQNSWSTHATSGARLGNEIREMTLNLPPNDPVTGDAFWGAEDNELDGGLALFDDLDDFDGDGDGLIFSAELGNGPVNARREVLSNMPGWAQIVTVENVAANNITLAEEDNATTVFKVVVVVTYQGPMDDEPFEVTRVSWISPN